MFSVLSKVNEVQSFVASRMKRVSTLNVKNDGSIKVKGCTLIQRVKSKMKSNLILTPSQFGR